jgi:hypothetical protein
MWSMYPIVLSLFVLQVSAQRPVLKENCDAISCRFENFMIAAVVPEVTSEKPFGGANCTKSSECNFPNGGDCDKDAGLCVCYKEYTGINCDYHRKSQTVAFLLSFFVGEFGADMFYLGVNSQAIPKLLCLILSIVLLIPASILSCCAGVASATDPEKGTTAEKAAKCCEVCSGCTATLLWVAVVLLLILVPIWWLINWAMIAANVVRDGNGEYPYSW